MPELFAQTWFQLGLGLVVVLPLLIVWLTEAIEQLGRRGRRQRQVAMQMIRNLVLPVAATLLFLIGVVGLDQELLTVRVIHTVFWICVINAALMLLNALLFEGAKGGGWRARMPKLFLDLSRVFLVVVGTAIVASVVWNADLGAFLAAVGVGSLVIGLALQDVLGNLLAGIVLLFERSFAVGDLLKIDDTIGRVVEVNWRAVRLEVGNKLMSVPNSALAQARIVNLDRPTIQHVEEVDLSFSFDDPPNKIKAVLTEAALATHGVLHDPAPQIHTLAYDGAQIHYQVELHMASFDVAAAIRDDFVSRVWYVARRHDFTLPFDYSGARWQPDTLEKSARLAAGPAMSTVADTAFDQAVGQPTIKHFGVGELVLTQGQPGDGLYIILEGQAVGIFVDEEGEEQEIVRLDHGELFGESTLFTGALSPMSVVAAEDLMVMVIDLDSVHALLSSAPQFGRDLGRTIEMRKKALRIAQQIPPTSATSGELPRDNATPVATEA